MVVDGAELFTDDQSLLQSILAGQFNGQLTRLEFGGLRRRERALQQRHSLLRLDHRKGGRFHQATSSI